MKGYSRRVLMAALACLLTLCLAASASAEFLSGAIDQAGVYSGSASLTINDLRIDLHTFLTDDKLELALSNPAYDTLEGQARFSVQSDGTMRFVVGDKATTFTAQELFGLFAAANGAQDERLQNYIAQDLMSDLSKLTGLLPYLPDLSKVFGLTTDANGWTLSFTGDSVVSSLRDFLASAAENENIIKLISSLSVWEVIGDDASSVGKDPSEAAQARQNLVAAALSSAAQAMQNFKLPISGDIRCTYATAGTPSITDIKLQFGFPYNSTQIEARVTSWRSSADYSLYIYSGSEYRQQMAYATNGKISYDQGGLSKLTALTRISDCVFDLNLERDAIAWRNGFRQWNITYDMMFDDAKLKTQLVLEGGIRGLPLSLKGDFDYSSKDSNMSGQLRVDSQSLLLALYNGDGMATLNADWYSGGYHLHFVSGSEYSAEVLHLDGQYSLEGDPTHNATLSVSDGLTDVFTATLQQKLQDISEGDQFGYRHTLNLTCESPEDNQTTVIGWDSRQIFGENIASEIPYLDESLLQEMSFMDFIDFMF